ncbi:unnamed protein product [Ilex paraguariensis]|uniref:RanBP2-type domain-containing protein n=1 Tax=Ilex paraguariensis TaxID=185542 RepID=A0ABC8R9H5_9AQUA
MAKNSLERYTHYYERWATNQSSRQKALADLHQMQTVHVFIAAHYCLAVNENLFTDNYDLQITSPGELGSAQRMYFATWVDLQVFIAAHYCLAVNENLFTDNYDLQITSPGELGSAQRMYFATWVDLQLEKLSDKQSQPESQLKFIIEAWLQIVECRRVLKWTYSYGYYLPENENAKRQFFEYLQGDAEAGLERLHQCVEKELQPFINAEGPSQDFNDFRTKLAGLTRLYDLQISLVDAENFADENMLCHCNSVTRNYFENLVKALENGLSDVDTQGTSSKTTNSKSAAGSSKGKVSRGKGASRSGGPSKNVDDSSSWACDHCTYFNPKSTNICQICNQRR